METPGVPASFLKVRTPGSHSDGKVMDIYWFCVAVLGVWRISHLVTFEDGPAQLVAKFRDAFERTYMRGLTSCFYCVSLWVSLPMAMLVNPHWRDRIVLCPALSGAAILLERMTGRPAAGAAVTPIFFEDEGENEHVLRPSKDPIPLS